MNIHIEFCVKWNYGPEFDRVSSLIRSIDSSIQVSSNQMPPRSGAFEVKVDEETVFSKFEIGRFPNEAEVRGWIKEWKEYI